MEQHAVQGSEGLKGDRNHALESVPGQYTKGDLKGAFDQKQNGGTVDNKPTLTNGVNGSSYTGDGKEPNASPSANTQDRLPPELEHWTHTYVPMGKLLERIAQQCYNDLQETIDGMTDMPVQHTPPALNGTSGHSQAAPDASPTSIDKKLRLMNFAQTQKDRFIKALVLSDWARNLDDMTKLIELRMWLQQQDDAASASADAIVQLKHNMIPAKMPNPNIEGALELLSTGKAPWMPDLGYIPPRPLTAQKLLKTLRDMNFTLSVRLNLYEDLPRHFCDYTIANGRATFAVPNEFEVVLAAADEDPESPFYFIDIRFLFSSAPQLSDGFMRSSLEAKVNEVLANDSLPGCYAFLHGLVLTHKINILRRQAQQMARGRWNGCVRIEPVHRSLVLQYWTSRTGGKNWVELGISSGAQTKSKQATISSQPQLQMRWFRDGQEVQDLEFDTDSGSLSMERILEQVITSHIVWRLTKIKDQLQAQVPDQTSFNIDMQTSVSDSGACLLKLRSNRPNQPVVLRITPVNGDISMSPVSSFSIDAEKRLNEDPAVDAGQVLTYFYCKTVQDRIGKQAQRVGWIHAQVGKQDNVKKIFGEDIMRRSTFVRPGWGTQWAIAVTINLTGEKWWTVHLDSNTLARTIRSAQLLPLPIALDITRASLLGLESKAIAQLSFLNITSQLRQSKIQYELRQAQTAFADDATHTTVLAMNFGDLVYPYGMHSSERKPWCLDPVLLTHHGVDKSPSGETNVVFIVKAVPARQIASDLVKYLKRDDGQDEDVSFSETGAFALRIRTHFGAGLVTALQARFRRIEQLSSYIHILQKHKAEVIFASVSRIVFTYHADRALSAEILFGPDRNDSDIQLRFRCAEGGKFGPNPNPHRRIQPLLQGVLKSSNHTGSTAVVDGSNRFASLMAVLSLTLPLLRGLDRVETADPSLANVRVSARAVSYYRLVYNHPLPNVVLDFELKPKDGRQMWFVRNVHQVENEEAAKILGQIWRTSVESWFGVGNGAIAGVDGVEDLLQRIDTAVRSAKTESESDGRKTKGNSSGHEIVILD